MRPSRIVTVTSVSGAASGVMGRTVTCVIATGSATGAGAARQLQLVSSSAAAIRRDMEIPVFVTRLRLVADGTGCIAHT